MRRFLLVPLFVVMPWHVQAQDNGAWIFDLLKSDGGCERQAPLFKESLAREIKNTQSGSPIGAILNRKAKDWSQDDITFAPRIFAHCEAKLVNSTSDEEITPVEIAQIEKDYADQIRQVVSMSRKDPAKRYGENFFTPDFCPPSWYGRGPDAKTDSNPACSSRLADSQARKELEKADQDRAAADRLKRQADEQAEALRSAKEEAAKAQQERRDAEQRLSDLRLQRSFTDSSRAEAEADTRRRNSEAFSAVNPRGSCKVSFDQFSRLRVGMSYDQVRRVFGCDGTEASQNRIGNVNTIMYNWSGGLISAAQVIFQNNRLVSKSQSGLD